MRLTWPATDGRGYQVEYSANLDLWRASPTGGFTATNATAQWLDAGPPATEANPFSVPQRFYRVFQYGAP